VYEDLAGWKLAGQQGPAQQMRPAEQVMLDCGDNPVGQVVPVGTQNPLSPQFPLGVTGTQQYFGLGQSE
jgi:hypothetical protein